MSAINCDLCVIGAGSGGLSVAAGAAQMGADTVLIERGAMGGDCLNSGCVPSKSLLAAAKAAESLRRAGRFGVNGHEPSIDFAQVHGHVRGVIDSIAPHDSQERFEGLGVRVIRAAARFTGPDAVEAGGITVRARRFVLATGSRPAVPPLPGLDALPFLTNETLFERTAAPEHLLVLGGGPIGVEMAQAHRRLGARVTMLVRSRLLPKDDPELVEVLRRRLSAEGVAILEGAAAAQAERAGNGVAVLLEDGRRIEGSDLLVATGRAPNLEDLGLDAAGIAVTKKGVKVDARLRTTNRHVFAVGDVTGGPAFTHVAGQHASVVIKNALFRLPAKVDYAALPWVTYAEPELAQVGLTEAAARERHGDGVRALTAPFAGNDRARTEAETEGLVKLVVTKRGRLLGAGIAGPHAGEQIALWCLAVAKRMGVGDVANLTLPYPTLAEAGKRAAGSFYTPTLFGPRTRGLVRFLGWFG
ncbi:dihydrolipoyl dehydrogenase family protein [Azospirillum rugosum]|uniref:Pyruvate/2-oxoglutarate dehydrogenase complex dihydrolipoamide dehydrogenase (E3) component n=1 Tax=Azospirillum rugosum TaxID=416170 RepID=A0ABS4SSI8_9PROT|nr:FAD-dependent oxidoreductase [Azospirillum rugosum]MBP2295204.1 pyruvate/2-oxoglutarate dehydrogenase complex dihydrolipoamide dehydrogenase (E3) component [Azospirillum rugosum]MDQ0528578.1 pyruvate/2-oxoglutarate dehydrogenase complex dihydrolipoamide dehydrogenase (E3) component [Azospirillum rugosum]